MRAGEQTTSTWKKFLPTISAKITSVYIWSAGILSAANSAPIHRFWSPRLPTIRQSCGEHLISHWSRLVFSIHLKTRIHKNCCYRSWPVLTRDGCGMLPSLQIHSNTVTIFSPFCFQYLPFSHFFASSIYCFLTILLPVFTIFSLFCFPVFTVFSLFCFQYLPFSHHFAVVVHYVKLLLQVPVDSLKRLHS